MQCVTTYFMIPLMTPTDGSSDGCFPALLMGVGPVSWTKPTRTPATPQQHGWISCLYDCQDNLMTNIVYACLICTTQYTGRPGCPHAHLQNTPAWINLIFIYLFFNVKAQWANMDSQSQCPHLQTNHSSNQSDWSCIIYYIFILNLRAGYWSCFSQTSMLSVRVSFSPQKLLLSTLKNLVCHVWWAL